MLVQTFFGADFGSALFEQLMRGYHELGPDGCSWVVGPAQRQAFAGIRDRLLAEIAGQPGRPGACPRAASPATCTPKASSTRPRSATSSTWSRRVATTRDIVFEGHLIPKGTIVRVCLWEAHNSADAFPDALRFDPERFLERDPSGDRFSPFGLDQHHCPLSEVTVELGTIFLRALARSYTVAPIDDGLPVRGRHHWEPASRFSVRLEERLVERGPG